MRGKKGRCGNVVPFSCLVTCSNIPPGSFSGVFFFFFFLKRSYLSHVFPIEIASANLFPQLLLPGSSLWWVDSGEVLCNLMHRCVSQNKMSRERGREEGRGRKRKRGVYVDRSRRGTRRAKSDQPWNGCCPGVGATLPLARFGITAHMDVHTKYNDYQCAMIWGMCLSECVVVCVQVGGGSFHYPRKLKPRKLYLSVLYFTCRASGCEVPLVLIWPRWNLI